MNFNGFHNLQFEALLQENTSDHVHHILVYKCDDLTNSSGANSSDVCEELHAEARRCRINLLIAGWAVGAQVCKQAYMSYIRVCLCLWPCAI